MHEENFVRYISQRPCELYFEINNYEHIFVTKHFSDDFSSIRKAQKHLVTIHM